MRMRQDWPIGFIGSFRRALELYVIISPAPQDAACIPEGLQRTRAPSVGPHDLHDRDYCRGIMVRFM
jgi:hypothetical protein